MGFFLLMIIISGSETIKVSNILEIISEMMSLKKKSNIQKEIK